MKTFSPKNAVLPSSFVSNHVYVERASHTSFDDKFNIVVKRA